MKLKTFIGVALMSCTVNAMAALETEADQLSYSLGARLAEQIEQFENINQDALSQGIRDVLNQQELLILPDDIKKNIEVAYAKQEGQRQRMLDQEASDNLQKGEAFLFENSQRLGVISLKSGLQYRVIKKSEGIKPTLTDQVVVHYEGRLLNGFVFDSTYERNKPATFQVNKIIPGWSEALQEMPTGSIWELYISPSLAYGSNGMPGKIAPNEVITFKVELQKIEKQF
ncbi:hypothetical protein ACH42_09185 [Endozoicomonas sp. (ex Bugula neritina AB1)]|nr:hypothetical protein ACH42_09185 [Endozoicomonas sp. (ex Bugula neritina AB1)]